MKTLKTFKTLAAVAASGVLALNLQAAVLLNINFDNDGTPGGPGNNPYTTGAGETIAAPFTVLNRNDTPQIAVSTGPQGGNMLTVNGTAGDQGYVTANATLLTGQTGFTAEALVNFSDLNTSHGGIVSANYFQGGFTPTLLMQTGTLIFYSGNVAASYTGLAINTWYHVAGVWKYDIGGNINQSQLYVNGALVATATAANAGVNQTLVGNSIGIGYEATAPGRGMIGSLDQVAISDVALAPGTFVIPEPATCALLALGATVTLVFRRRRAA